MERKSLIVVAHVNTPDRVYFGGGALRSYRSVREYAKFYDVHLILPPPPALYVNRENYLPLKELQRILNIKGLYRVRSTISILGSLYFLTPPAILKGLLLGIPREIFASAVIVLDENHDSISIGRMLKRALGMPALLLLQLPLFYGNRERRRQLMRAYDLWFRELYIDQGGSFESLRGHIWRYGYRVEWSIRSSRIAENLLREYDIVAATSEAIPVEMGERWVSRIYALKPGVSLDREDLAAILRVRNSVRDKGEHVIYCSRIHPLKGFIEAIYAFKALAKRCPGLKLIVTGDLGRGLGARVERFIKNLGLGDRVVFTGVVSREELFRLIASARLVIYPSHVDSFSYVVLESLYLGTPVVAYSIPALKIYYGRSSGVRLVKEGDIEALATEAFEILEKRRVEIRPPPIRSWDEIMREELFLIKSLVREEG